MKTIERLRNLPPKKGEMFIKINEIIDVLNELQKYTYIGPGPLPNPYDLNAVNKILKRKQP